MPATAPWTHSTASTLAAGFPQRKGEPSMLEVVLVLCREMHVALMGTSA